MRRHHQIRLPESYEQTTLSWAKGVRCAHDGSSMETIYFPAFKRSGHSVLQSWRLSNRTNTRHYAPKRRIYIHMGNQRQIPMDRQCDVEKMGLQSS